MPRLPWAAQQATVLRSRLPRAPETETLLGLVSSALAPSTISTYASRWAQFARFCEARRLRCLPATPETVALFVTYLFTIGSVKPDSVGPYISAINTAHRDVLAPEPGGSPLVKQVRAGWRRRVSGEPGVQRDRRLPLPASVALRALRAGLALVQQRMPPQETARRLRPLAFVALTFATLMRASSAVPLARDDVAHGAAEIVVRPRVIKGGQLKSTLPSPKRLPTPHCRDLNLLLLSWRVAQNEAFAAARATPPLRAAAASQWQLPGESLRNASALATAWVQDVCERLGAKAPLGGKYTSHSLRKGGASAAYAVGVNLRDLCDLGDWAPGSPVPMKHYIDLSVVACDAARAFFGFRVRAG